MTDLLVLREATHGAAIEEYAAALRERLPDADVRLARTPGEERELIAGATVVAGMRIDEDLLERASQLAVFACTFAGTGHLPMDALNERGVAVTNASGVHGPPVSEHAIGGLLSIVRRFHVSLRNAERNNWRHHHADELYGSTVTVVGQGAIGTALVERLSAFGVETIGVRHSPEKGGPADEVVGYGEFGEVLGRTDHLLLACPLTDTTRGLVDREAFVTLPSDAVLVNVARGAVVDTDALLEALHHNRVAGAALDVTDPEPLPPDHPLWGFENVLVTPHNAGYTPDYYDRLADIVAENVRRHRRGDPLRNRVNGR